MVLRKLDLIRRLPRMVERKSTIDDFFEKKGKLKRQYEFVIFIYVFLFLFV